jgi:hypothetical protein
MPRSLTLVLRGPAFLLGLALAMPLELFAELSKSTLVIAAAHAATVTSRLALAGGSVKELSV